MEFDKFPYWGGETEVATGAVLQKKLYLKILQHSEENTCVGVSF